MRVYEFEPPDGYEWAQPEDPNGFEVFRDFDGTARAANWTPIQMRLLREDEGQKFLRSDMPWLGEYAPVLKSNAVEQLGSVLTKNGELLPLECDEMPLWVFNVTTVLDALDLKQSDIIRFPSGGIMDVNAYIFQPSRIHDESAFRVPDLDTVFITEDVVKLAGKLAGVGFKLLWEESVPSK